MTRSDTLGKRTKLQQAAKFGNVDNIFELACSYDFDPPKNKHAAIRWYEKAAELGHAEAQNFLGEIYRDGRGVGQDFSKAAHLFQLAAAQGLGDAQLSLGFCFRYGKGVDRDDTQALNWYKKAAKNGCPKAMSNIGRMYGSGEAVTQSWPIAIKWYKKSAMVDDNVTAVHWLARIYNGQEDYPEDLHQAIYWLEKASIAGDMQSHTDLGIHYFNGTGVEEDVIRAAELYRLGAEQGDSWAQYLLGLCYRDGTGVRKNIRVAISWWKKASSAHPEARKQLAKT